MSNDITDLRDTCRQLQADDQHAQQSSPEAARILDSLRGVIKVSQRGDYRRNSVRRTLSESTQLVGNNTSSLTNNARVHQPQPVRDKNHGTSSQKRASETTGTGIGSAQASKPSSQFSVHPLLNPNLCIGELTDLNTEHPMAMYPEVDAPDFMGRYHLGYVEPRNGRRGRWEYFTDGFLADDLHHGTSSEVAHRLFGGRGHFMPDTNEPTARQVQELRQRLRGDGSQDLRDDIDICWVPDTISARNDGNTSSVGARSMTKGKENISTMNAGISSNAQGGISRSNENFRHSFYDTTSRSQ